MEQGKGEEQKMDKKKILVVVDMQNDFINGSLGTGEAQAIVENAVSVIEAFEGTIFVTMDTHQSNYLETAEGKKLPVVHCVRETDGWQLNERIMTAVSQKEYTVIEKGTFGSTRLVEEIAKVGTQEELEIECFGLCTDICVVSNVLLIKASFPEAKITVRADCCAGVTPETHEAALTTMKMCQIEMG